MIFKIAKAELRSVFFSPIAWFISIVFLFMWGMSYSAVLLSIANFQELYIRFDPNFKGFPFPLTLFVLGPVNGILGYAVKYLFLFIPLLTMGLMSKEASSGTEKLLFSSPIKTRQIVLGKYLGMMLYNLLLLLILCVFLVSIALSIQSVDYGYLFSAAIGIYLLMCTYAAIGMFMSSITGYQIVSAIATFVVLGALNYIGNLWQRIDIVRDLTYFLSLYGRSEKILSGLITTKDMVYFLVVIALFVAFTIIKVKSRRESKPWFIQTGRYALALAATLLVGYISSRPTFIGYWDVTAEKVNTIPVEIQNIVKQLDKGPVEVTLYTNLTGEMVEYGLPENRNKYLTNVWEPYLRFKPDITFKYEYYYDYADGGGEENRLPSDELKKRASNMARSLQMNLSEFKKPEEIRELANLKDESFRPVMKLRYGTQTSFLRAFRHQSIPQIQKEQMEAAALKRLLVPTPKIYFITGHFERDIQKIGEREFGMYVADVTGFDALINHGFENDTISLDSRDIPVDASILVLADPKINLTTSAIVRLRQYIDNGGNMIILGEPGKQLILNPLLQQFGISMLNGQMVQPSKDETPDKVTPYATDNIADISTSIATTLRTIKTYGKALVLLTPGVAALALDSSTQFVAKPFFSTASKDAWYKPNKLVTDSADVIFNPQEGDNAASFPVAFGLTRKVHDREQRILIVGDADFMSAIRFTKNQNLEFNNAIFSWMSYGAFPIYAPRTEPKDVVLLVRSPSAKVQKIIYVWILPCLILLWGIVFLIKRNRK